MQNRDNDRTLCQQTLSVFATKNSFFCPRKTAKAETEKKLENQNFCKNTETPKHILGKKKFGKKKHHEIETSLQRKGNEGQMAELL